MPFLIGLTSTANDPTCSSRCRSQLNSDGNETLSNLNRLLRLHLEFMQLLIRYLKMRSRIVSIDVRNGIRKPLARTLALRYCNISFKMTPNPI